MRIRSLGSRRKKKSMQLARRFHRRRLIIGILPILFMVVWIWSCSASNQGAKSQETSQAKVDEPKVELLTPEGRRVLYGVELARTPEERGRGLMYRKTLKQDRGMFFIFSSSTIQSFWMKNTLIPLDMIFIDENLKVAGIVENAQPHDLSGQHINRPSRYVLEVNSGETARHGIVPGTLVVPQGFKP